MTVTGIARDSWKIWVMPSFSPRMPLMSLIASQLDLDVHAGRQVQPLELLHRLGCGVDDVDQPFVREHLEVLARILVLVRGPDHRIDVALGGQRHGTDDPRSGAGDVLDDVASRHIKHAVVVGPELDTDLRSRHGPRAPLPRPSTTSGSSWLVRHPRRAHPRGSQSAGPPPWRSGRSP